MSTRSAKPGVCPDLTSTSCIPVLSGRDLGPSTEGRMLTSRLLVGPAVMFGMAIASIAADAKIGITAPWTLATPCAPR
jgi:hypothetical protein